MEKSRRLKSRITPRLENGGNPGSNPGGGDILSATQIWVIMIIGELKFVVDV